MNEYFKIYNVMNGVVIICINYTRIIIMSRRIFSINKRSLYGNWRITKKKKKTTCKRSQKRDDIQILAFIFKFMYVISTRYLQVFLKLLESYLFVLFFSVQLHNLSLICFITCKSCRYRTFRFVAVYWHVN